MAQHSQPSTYTQGYSNYTTATHESRTAESEAAFLLPYIKKTDSILDVGCGPGTITTGFARYASEGTTIGIDISTAVLQKAKKLAAEANVLTEGPGSVVFKEGNILHGLPYPDDTFDVIFCSHLFGHIPPPDLPRRALAELRRVLKPGGIIATREGANQHFYPKSLDLDRLWVHNQNRAFGKGVAEVDRTGTLMPSLFRSVGFDVDGGKVRVGAGTTVFSSPEARKFLAWRGAGQLQEGDALRQSWLDAGITEDEIQETLLAVQNWAEMDGAWYAALHCEVLAWK